MTSDNNPPTGRPTTERSESAKTVNSRTKRVVAGSGERRPHPKKHELFDPYDRFSYGSDVPNNHADRARWLLDNVGKEAQMDYILRTVSRLMSSGATKIAISKMFNVSYTTVTKWCKKVDERIKVEMMSIDTHTHIGRALSHYNQALEVAVQNMHKPSNSTRDRLLAVEKTVSVLNARETYLAGLGFYDDAKMKGKGTDDPQRDEADKIIEAVKDITTGTYELSDELSDEISEDHIMSLDDEELEKLADRLISKPTIEDDSDDFLGDSDEGNYVL